MNRIHLAARVADLVGGQEWFRLMLYFGALANWAANNLSQEKIDQIFLDFKEKVESEDTA